MPKPRVRDRSEIPGVDLRVVRRPFSQAQYLIPGGLGTAKSNLTVLIAACKPSVRGLTLKERTENACLRADLHQAMEHIYRAERLITIETINRLYELKKLSIKRQIRR